MFYMFPRMVKPEVCNEIVEECLSKNLEPATIGDSLRDDPDIRKTSVYFIPTSDQKNKANILAWNFLKEGNKQFFNYDLTYFERIQFAKYSNGAFYDWHVDVDKENKPNKTRKLSLSLMLSDPDTFEGGEFQFYNGGKPIQDGDIKDDQVVNDLKAQGTVVVFDSRDWHRVTPVTQGTRYSIVSWASGASFK